MSKIDTQLLFKKFKQMEKYKHPDKRYKKGFVWRLRSKEKEEQ